MIFDDFRRRPLPPASAPAAPQDEYVRQPHQVTRYGRAISLSFSIFFAFLALMPLILFRLFFAAATAANIDTIFVTLYFSL